MMFRCKQYVCVVVTDDAADWKGHPFAIVGDSPASIFRQTLVSPQEVEIVIDMAGERICCIQDQQRGTLLHISSWGPSGGSTSGMGVTQPDEG